MAKLYGTSDVKARVDRYIQESGAALINDRDLSEENILRFVNELRIFRKYADELIEEMEEDDRVYDEEMAAWKAKAGKETQNGTDS